MATTKVRDYAKLARDIRNAIDEKNIISATHCATRLRLTLKKSPSEEVTKRISEMPAVIQVVAQVDDPIFAEGLLGQGIAIVPSEGRLYSPVEGTVVSVFNTKHALTIKTDQRRFILWHYRKIFCGAEQ